jgi:hypothetical protein
LREKSPEPLAERRRSDHNDDDQAGHLDRRQEDVHLDPLGDAAQVDGRHDQDEGDRSEHERQLHELAEVVAREGARACSPSRCPRT